MKIGSIFFLPTGARVAVDSEAVNIADLGPRKVKRASNVEFNDKTQEWEGTLEGESVPLFRNKSRAKVIKAEVAHLEADMMAVAAKHFPQLA
jgi:hypothetical protein